MAGFFKDALKRSTLGSGSGVGLRAGTFQGSVDANGNQTTTLTDCMFATDVTIKRFTGVGSRSVIAADLAVSSSGTAGGNLHGQGTWEAPGPGGEFQGQRCARRKAGGRALARSVDGEDQGELSACRSYVCGTGALVFSIGARLRNHATTARAI